MTEPTPGVPRPAVPDLEPVRFGAAMVESFGWLFYVLGLGRLTARLRLEEHSAEQVKVAEERGPLVYVLAGGSILDHLALNAVLVNRKLPLSVWNNGGRSFLWQPVLEAWRDVWTRWRLRLEGGVAPDPVRSGWLAQNLSRRQPVTLFLEPAMTPWDRLLKPTPAEPFDAVLEAQELGGDPVQLLPVVVVWNRAPQRSGGQIDRFFQGVKDQVGLLRQLVTLWFDAGDGFIQIGEPLDLQQFRERFEDQGRQVKALRTVLRRYLKRESQLVRGPRLLPPQVLQRVVLENPSMRAFAREEALAQGKSEEAVRREMQKVYGKIAARFNWGILLTLDLLLRPLWTRVFSGVDVRDQDLARIRAAMRDGTAVLVPSHKSHFDYLLLSWVLYEHDLIVPHVVAGLNLAIWPVSIVLRGAGGFFIKRSFKGDRVFPAVFARYLGELVRLGYPIEFFIEGARTRSGKLLPPRPGVLEMLFEASEVRRQGQEVTILPIALAYEQVAEEASYARELGGEAKVPESVGQLVKARSVFSRRFGRVYLRVGEPLRCSELVDATADRKVFSERERDEKRDLLNEIGETILHRVGQATVVLPTSLVAAALLAHHRRGIKAADLTARTERFRAFLQRCGALESASMARFGPAIAMALDRLHNAGRLQSYDAEGTRVWGIEPAQRITLDFYRNQILHFFAPAGYAAAAIRAVDRKRFRVEDGQSPFQFLVWLWRREFRLDPARSATALLIQGLIDLEAHGAIRKIDDDHYEIADEERIGEIYGLFRPLLEAYAHALGRLAALVPFTGDRDELSRRLQTDGEAAISAGTITRPEALSLVTLKNAVDTLRDDGVLAESGGVITENVALRQHHRDRLAPMVD